MCPEGSGQAGSWGRGGRARASVQTPPEGRAHTAAATPTNHEFLLLFWVGPEFWHYSEFWVTPGLHGRA